jgi:N-methylhydantoinase A/oxoprolinase/acetone carboxylase beta subunit
VIDDSRGYISATATVDRQKLQHLADDLLAAAQQELAIAGVPVDRQRFEWSLLLVYPGQTFDTAIPVAGPTDVEAAVAEFHRRNAEARLIEAKAQEPVLRGIRLTAIGAVSQPAEPDFDTGGSSAPIGHRRMWLADAWHDHVPVYALAQLRPGAQIPGPAAISSPYTTVILAPRDNATLTARGDLLIHLED